MIFEFFLLQISSLLEPLIQLVKTGFTKAAQRLDGIYALLLVVKIAAVDIKAGMAIMLTFYLSYSVFTTNLKFICCLFQHNASFIPFPLFLSVYSQRRQL